MFPPVQVPLVPSRPFDVIGREEFVRLERVPWRVYRALGGRPVGSRPERYVYHQGLLEIELPNGPPADVVAPPPGGWREEFIRLHDVPGWIYEELSAIEGNEHARFTYSDRALEIEVPAGVPHERVSQLIVALITAFAELRGPDFFTSGTATWRPTAPDDPAPRTNDRPPGLQGDQTFHIRSFEAVRGIANPSPEAGDPPPDLAVEVVFGSPLRRKREIYAELGVGELWVWARGALTASVLTPDGAYAPADDSPNLPGLPFALAADLIARRDELGQTELLRRFRGALGSVDTEVDGEGGEPDHPREVLRLLLIAGGGPPEVFQAAEEPLHHVPAAVPPLSSGCGTASHCTAAAACGSGSA